MQTPPAIGPLWLISPKIALMLTLPDPPPHFKVPSHQVIH